MLAKPSTKTKITPRAMAAAFSFGPDPLFDPDRPAGAHNNNIIITIKINFIATCEFNIDLATDYSH